ncbi:hypothetical protein M3649_04005 [Ureibacillus chungkukjangi]|uniref:hypothetical protein n=1 Tax=Ureibacillus chungkukjangi TaxID=1202712 RepID=UPI00203FA63F|nr:hypothetical protein [Ureibacillus chungkukjangi]MCM3387296.1 hypothetical protein [Ureibacillus chungkukjangi]
MTNLNGTQVMELINSELEYAIEATENSFRNKCFVVLQGNQIQKFAKTKRGAESYIKNHSFSYYDEYFMEMREAGEGLYIVEVLALDIVDYFNTPSIWFTTLKNRWSRRQTNEYMIEKALQLGVSEEVLNTIKFVLAESDNNSFPSYEKAFGKPEQVEEVKNEVAATIEEAPESVKTVEETNNNTEITYKLNEEKNGIEIYFTDKPEEEIRNLLKASGFRWSKYNKCWYAKQSEKTNRLAEQLSNSKVSTTDFEPVEIELIELDAIDQYTISEQLESRLNGSSFFPHKKGYYTEDLQATFEKNKNEAMKVIELTEDIYYKNKVISLFNRYMKNYHTEYVSYLNMKANNPSWAVTGRGNMNVSRYNKKQDQMFNKMGKTVEIGDKFVNDLERIERKIINHNHNKKQQTIDEVINNTNESIPFQTKKREILYFNRTHELRTYNSTNYFIVKFAGCFRIFEIATAKEVHAMKTKDKLDHAKQYVTYLESLKVNEAI